jgi:hypothetical protein
LTGERVEQEFAAVLAADVAGYRIGRLPNMKACDSSRDQLFSFGGTRPNRREVYLPEHLFDDQITEILCTHCHQTSPKTIAWVRANDQYNCPGCNARIIVERDALLAAALTEDR